MPKRTPTLSAERARIVIIALSTLFGRDVILLDVISGCVQVGLARGESHAVTPAMPASSEAESALRRSVRHRMVIAT